MSTSWTRPITPQLIAVGAVTLLGQVVLLRELAVVFDGSELMMLVGLAGWLLGAGLGAAVGRPGATPSPLLVRLALLAYALLLPLSVAGTRALPTLLGAPPGGALPWAQQLAVLAASVLPCALMAGALFRLAARAWLGDDRSIAQAYGWESLGAVVAGGLSVALAGLGQANLVATFATALLAVVAAALPGPGSRGWLKLLSLPGSVVLVILLAASGPIDRALTSMDQPGPAESWDSPYGRITIADVQGQRVVYHNGALRWESQDTDAELLVHAAALQVDAPSRVLLLGGAERRLLEPLWWHRPQQVDLVEPDETLVAQLPERADDRALEDIARITTTHFDDPRAFLADAPRYDLILISQPEPATVAASRTWTAEFFAQCAAHMEPGAVLAFQLPADENLWSPTLSWRNATIHRALTASFDDVLVLPGSTTTWLAARIPLERGASVLGRQLVARAVQSELVSEPYLEYLLTNDRTAEIEASIAASPAEANRDDRPAATTATLLLWLARFHPALALKDPGPWLMGAQRAALPIAGGLGLLLLVAAGVARRWRPSRRVGLALVAGLLGTLLEGVLLIRFQVQHGVLYGQLGLLLAAFMAGLAGGALGLDPLLRRVSDVEGAPAWLRWALGGTGVAVAVVVLLAPGHWSALVPTAGLLAAAGAVTATLFGLAGSIGSPDPRRLAGPLYGADLLGGCAGLVLASLLLIPLLGLGLTAGVAILVALAGLLLLA